MKLLGIETSCDETAIAVVEDGSHIHSDIVASQAELHSGLGQLAAPKRCGFE